MTPVQDSCMYVWYKCYISVYVYEYIYVCLFICAHSYACMCIYMHVPTSQHHDYKQTHRPGGKSLGPRVLPVWFQELQSSPARHSKSQLANAGSKNDSTLIRVDLDFKNAFNSAGHSCLWSILEGLGVPDVCLLKNIYERSFMRV